MKQNVSFFKSKIGTKKCPKKYLKIKQVSAILPWCAETWTEKEKKQQQNWNNNKKKILKAMKTLQS